MSEEQSPRMSRRHAAGSPSARGLLFTVLGEFVLPGGDSAWTSALIAVLGRLGVEEKAARQALMRTAGDGWLKPERVGRRTRWHLTPAGERLLTEGRARIYGFSGAGTSWDRRWVVVLARSPETERASRHLVRTRLTWAGFGSPAPGVWVSANTDRVDEATRVLAEAGITDAQVFVGEHAGGGDVLTMVRAAWDLDDIERRYERFVTDFADGAAADPLARLTELVHAWRRFPAIDPGLPRDLLPDGWRGVTAARLFAERHAQWTPDARRAWCALAAGPASDVTDGGSAPR